MILGISGSPRADGVTAAAVKKVLAECDGETKYISLAGKKITGCISCLACTKDNNCIVEDDFQEIAKEMLKADAIVIGAPDYYNLPNGLSHCLLERCFCFRHQNAFLLKDKPAVLISSGYSSDEENNQVLKIMENFMAKNKVKTLSKFLVAGFSQCYTCDYGHNCVAGNVVNKYGVVDEIRQEMMPPKLQEQKKSIKKCEKAALILNMALNDNA